MKQFHNILVGQNAKENDFLWRNAEENDLWFHLKDTSSPHVILRTSPDHESGDIRLAAQYVKMFSKEKTKKVSAVIYCHVKNIKGTKTKGEVILIKSPYTLRVTNTN